MIGARKRGYRRSPGGGAMKFHVVWGGGGSFPYGGIFSMWAVFSLHRGAIFFVCGGRSSTRSTHALSSTQPHTWQYIHTPIHTTIIHPSLIHQPFHPSTITPSHLYIYLYTYTDIHPYAYGPIHQHTHTDNDNNDNK